MLEKIVKQASVYLISKGQRFWHGTDPIVMIFDTGSSLVMLAAEEKILYRSIFGKYGNYIRTPQNLNLTNPYGMNVVEILLKHFMQNLKYCKIFRETFRKYSIVKIFFEMFRKVLGRNIT